VSPQGYHDVFRRQHGADLEDSIAVVGQHEHDAGDISGTFSQVKVVGDIWSANWDGAVPADLTSGPDTAATAGFYLDASAGAIQSMALYAEGGQIGNLDIPGMLALIEGGSITSGSVPGAVVGEAHVTWRGGATYPDVIQFYSGDAAETAPAVIKTGTMGFVDDGAATAEAALKIQSPTEDCYSWIKLAPSEIRFKICGLEIIHFTSAGDIDFHNSTITNFDLALDDLTDVTITGTPPGGTVTNYPSSDFGYIWTDDPADFDAGNYWYAGREDSSDPATHAWSRHEAVPTITPQTAVLWMPAYYWPSSETMVVNLYGVDEDDHQAPVDAASWGVDHAAHTTATVALTLPAYADYLAGMPIGLFCDPTAILTEIQTRPGWVSGNDIGLHADFISGAEVAANYFGDIFGPALSVSAETWPYPTGFLGSLYGFSSPATVYYPPDMVAGETVLCLMVNSEGIYGSATSSVWPAGWTKLKEVVNGQASLHIAWHKVTGTEDPTFEVSWTGTGRPIGWLFRVAGAANPTVTPPTVSTGVTGSSTTPAPDSISPGVGRHLILAAAARKSGSYNVPTAVTGEIARSSFFSLFWSDDATVNPDPLDVDVTGLWAAATVCVFRSNESSLPADNDLLAFDLASELWINQTAIEAGVIPIIITPADNHFPYQKADGTLDDSGYDAADFAPAAHVGATGAAHGDATAVVAGFLTAADFTKLAGVEAAATADQSAAEILAALLTVDGAGTLLDADRLDGVEAAALATVGSSLPVSHCLFDGDDSALSDLSTAVTGDLDVRARIRATDWTPSDSRTIASQCRTTGGDAAESNWYFFLTNTGYLSLFVTTDGANWLGRTSTVVLQTAASLVDNVSDIWVRAIHDVNNGASGNDIKFYYSTDGTTWTQLGTTVTNTGTSSRYNSTFPHSVGAFGSYAYRWVGRIYEVEVRSGIAGTVVASTMFDQDPWYPGVTVADDDQGNTWTLTGCSIVGGHDHDGVYPSKSAAAYTPSNVTEDRAYDADTVLVAELADIVGTLIADLKATGIIQ
jgi:hypothetical protein